VCYWHPHFGKKVNWPIGFLQSTPRFISRYCRRRSQAHALLRWWRLTQQRSAVPLAAASAHACVTKLSNHRLAGTVLIHRISWRPHRRRCSSCKIYPFKRLILRKLDLTISNIDRVICSKLYNQSYVSNVSAHSYSFVHFKFLCHYYTVLYIVNYSTVSSMLTKLECRNITLARCKAAPLYYVVGRKT